MYRISLALVVSVLCARIGAADDDSVKTKLDAAKKEYETKLVKFKEAANAWFDKREEAARKNGDKPLVDQIKLMRQQYADTGLLPVVPPLEMRKLQTGAQTAYEAALVTAVKDYTKAKKDDEAEVVTKLLKEFREEIDPRTQFKKPLVGTWAITMGTTYKAEWTFKEDGTVTCDHGAVKEGKWSVDQNKGIILIFWNKEYVDKFDLPLNSTKTIGAQVGRQNMKLEAVKLP